LTEELQAIASTLSDQLWVEKLIVDIRAPEAAGPVGLPLADLEEAFATAAAAHRVPRRTRRACRADPRQGTARGAGTGSGSSTSRRLWRKPAT
jgi:hypothetical protein